MAVNKPEFIVVHHEATGVIRTGPRFAIVNQSHKQRGFPVSRAGWHVGYHFWIEKDGKLIQARDEDEVGAHCVEQRMNFRSIGIGLAGDFNLEDPTPEQVSTLRTLLRALMEQLKIPASNVVAHRFFATVAGGPKETRWRTYTGTQSYKTCFGDRLKDSWIEKIATASGSNEPDVTLGNAPKGHDAVLAQRLAGRILLAVDRGGELWYCDPTTRYAICLGTLDRAVAMKLAKTAVGITTDNLKRIAQV